MFQMRVYLEEKVVTLICGDHILVPSVSDQGSKPKVATIGTFPL